MAARRHGGVSSPEVTGDAVAHPGVVARVCQVLARARWQGENGRNERTERRGEEEEEKTGEEKRGEGKSGEENTGEVGKALTPLSSCMPDRWESPLLVDIGAGRRGKEGGCQAPLPTAAISALLGPRASGHAHPASHTSLLLHFPALSS